MCNPLAVVMLVTAAVSVYSQQEQSKVQNDIFENNQKNALVAQKDGYDAQAAQSNQERASATQQATQNAIAAAKARATANVAANESGVGGLAIDAIMQDITRQEAGNFDTLAANQEWGEEQRSRNAMGLRSQTQDRINSTPRGNFNPILGLLQIGASTAGGYYQGKAK